MININKHPPINKKYQRKNRQELFDGAINATLQTGYAKSTNEYHQYMNHNNNISPMSYATSSGNTSNIGDATPISTTSSSNAKSKTNSNNTRTNSKSSSTTKRRRELADAPEIWQISNYEELFNKLTNKHLEYNSISIHDYKGNTSVEGAIIPRLELPAFISEKYVIPISIKEKLPYLHPCESTLKYSLFTLLFRIKSTEQSGVISEDYLKLSFTEIQQRAIGLIQIFIDDLVLDTYKVFFHDNELTEIHQQLMNIKQGKNILASRNLLYYIALHLKCNIILINELDFHVIFTDKVLQRQKCTIIIYNSDDFIYYPVIYSITEDSKTTETFLLNNENIYVQKLFDKFVETHTTENPRYNDKIILKKLLNTVDTKALKQICNLNNIDISIKKESNEQLTTELPSVQSDNPSSIKKKVQIKKRSELITDIINKGI